MKIRIGHVGLVVDDGDTEVLAGGNRFEGNTYLANRTRNHWSWNRAVNWATWRGTYGQDLNGKVS